MTRIRQVVSFLMILVVVSMFSAPLLACEAAGHRCAMMSHAPKAAAPAHAANHSCCPKKGSEAPAKKSCHENVVIMMPAECASSTQCCDMGNAPVVSVVQVEPAKKSLLAIVSDPPPDPLMMAARHIDRSAALPRHPRPVFDLKTDLRI